MSKAIGSQSELTRRSFLKTSGIAVGALGLAGAAGMVTADNWLSPTNAHAESEERYGYTFHQRHCQCHCHLKCTVRDDRLVLVEPNDWPDKRNETICLKGISEIQHVYSPDRIQVPLKRVGERGEGKFIEITWDEALDLMVEEYKKAVEKYGKVGVCTAPAVDGLQVNMNKYIGGQVTPTAGIDRGYGNGYSPAIAESGKQGASSNEIKDWKNAKTILNVGCNVLETCMVTARYFYEAKEAGAEIITIDPTYCTTAAKSSRWIPITPGTDAALYLGMISVILDNEWYDRDYLMGYTSMPFLVKISDGSLLRRDPLSDDAQAGADNPFMVVDAKTGLVVAYNEEGVAPELEASVVVDGEECQTVFARLLDTQKPYTSAWAAEKTGIDESVLLEITEKYACNGPSILSFGFGGGEKFVNSDVSGHSAVLLASLVGSFGSDVPGRGAGAYVNAYQKIFGAASLPAWPLPSEFKSTATPKDCADYRDETSGIHWLHFSGAHLTQHAGNQERTFEWARSLDFIVVQEVYHTTDVDWADLVLPVCSHFETENEIGYLRPFRGHAMLQMKVLDPLFESHSDFWIETEFAKRLGYEDIIPKSLEEVTRYQLDNATDEAIRGITLEQLIENQGLVALNKQVDIARRYENHTFKTASGKIDLYYENQASFDQALPTWEEPNEAYSDNPLREQYPLTMLQRRTKYHIHGMFNDATWIRQYSKAQLEINPVDAKARGLASGDVVEVYNDRGSFSCECVLTNAVQPGTTIVVEGAWEKHMVSGIIQNVTNDFVTPRWQVLMNGRVTGFNDSLVEVKKA